MFNSTKIPTFRHPLVVFSKVALSIGIGMLIIGIIVFTVTHSYDETLAGFIIILVFGIQGVVWLTIGLVITGINNRAAKKLSLLKEIGECYVAEEIILIPSNVVRVNNASSVYAECIYTNNSGQRCRVKSRMFMWYRWGREKDNLHAIIYVDRQDPSQYAVEMSFNEAAVNNRVDFDELNVLDLFAGIGSISYEFASRGVKSVLAVDNHLKCTDFIKQTIDQLRIENLHVMRADVFAYIAKTRQTFDLIFADPPYDLPTIHLLPSLIFEYKLLNPNGYFILEHSESYDFSNLPQFLELRKYGKVHFSFFNQSTH